MDLLGTYTPIGGLVVIILFIGFSSIKGWWVALPQLKEHLAAKDDVITSERARADTWEKVAHQALDQNAELVHQADITAKFFSEVSAVPRTGDNGQVERT